MNDVVTFDSCTHPTLDGSWPFGGGRSGCGFDELISEMDASGTDRAVAIGLEGVGGYEAAAFAAAARSYGGRLLPVGEIDPSRVDGSTGVREVVDQHARLGFAGVKFHPRRSKVNLSHPLLVPLMVAAAERGMVPFLCTYFYGPEPSDAANDVRALRELFAALQDAPLVALHGGAMRVLEVAEAARPFPRILVDLSFTLCRFAGSSVDLDITTVCRTFDRRVSVGSDYPEYSLSTTRQRFAALTDGLGPDVRANIGGANLARMLEDAS